MSDEIFYRNFLNRDRLVHICDPDLQTCEQLSLLFRLEGFQTTFSVDIPGFLAMVERRRPDIVVANFDLGVDDGLELLRRIKGLRMGTPVFMLENHPLVEAAVQAMKLGAADVVTKPIDTERLVRSVRDALRKDVHVGAMQSGGRPATRRNRSRSRSPATIPRRSPRPSPSSPVPGSHTFSWCWIPSRSTRSPDSSRCLRSAQPSAP